MMLLVLVLAALAEVAAPAAKSVIVQPAWVRKPTGEDMGRHYPQRALKMGLAGRAVITCNVDAEGGLVNCLASEENPADLGFGEAALKMAPLFRMRPMTANGQPVGGGTVRIPILFRLPDQGMDQLSGSLMCYGRMASAAEANPADSEKWYAARFWALQVMAVAATAHQPPSGVERDLTISRMAAAQQPNGLKAQEETEICAKAMQKAAGK